MKAEMTVADTSRISGSGLYGGMATGLAQPVTSAPDNNNLVKFPLQTKGNTQGQVFSLFYAYSDDLKKQGA
jgi:pantothenate kinase